MFKDYKKIAKQYGVGGDGGWMQLKEGDNKVRIVSNFVSYGFHFMGKGNPSLTCLGKEQCEQCQVNKKPRVQFIGWVIDRIDSELKVIRVGYQIYSSIGKFAESDEYAFDELPPYDITINATGEGLERKYTAMPARQNTDLTNDEKLAIDEKVKDPQEIIDAMKAKVAVSENQEDFKVPDNEDIDPKDIPF